MSTLIEKGIISEMECGSNFAYILGDASVFSSTEYKVLQSQTNTCFINCMKMMYNGRVQLYYNVSNFKPLSSLLPMIGPEGFTTVLGNLLAGVIDIKNNGFLSCQNIDGSFEHIYVDPSTYKVALVYLPLNVHEYDDDAAYESALRAYLIRVVTGTPAIASPQNIQLCTDLQNGKLSIEDLYSGLGKGRRAGRVDYRTRGGSYTPPSPTGYGSAGGRSGASPSGPSAAGTGGIRFVALNAPTRVEITINKPEFTIGKKNTNDGIVSFNNMISRTHCKVINKNGNYYIQDLQSANGTYVNGARLLPGQSFPIKVGDTVRLADSDFEITK